MEIKDIINNIYRLPPASFERLVASISEVEYPKYAHLHRENRKETRSYFIKEGIARAYARKDDKDVTFWFGREGDWIVPVQSFLTGVGEHASIELLEDCILYEIDMNRLQRLYLSDIHLANWGRRFAEHSCIKAERLFISRQFKTLSEVYSELIASCPDIIQRVPLRIIASYLGISQASLSRIRAQIC